MTPRGRVPKTENEGHRPAVGKGDALDLPPVPTMLAGASAPDDFRPIEREVWDLCIADMAKLGHLREPDLLLLRAYCETAAVMVESAACIRELGAMMKEPIIVVDPETMLDKCVGFKVKANPAVKQHRDSMNALRLLSNELALNPLARIRSNLMEVATAGIATTILADLEALVDKKAAPVPKVPTKRASAKKKTTS